MRQTHTFATLAVSASTFEEVERLLRAAHYHHVFVGGAIDMNGIGLIREEPRALEADAPEPGEGYSEPFRPGRRGLR